MSQPKLQEFTDNFWLTGPMLLGCTWVRNVSKPAFNDSHSTMRIHTDFKMGSIRLVAMWSLTIGLPSFAYSAEEVPSAKAILKTVRVAQSAQNMTVTGKLRAGGKSKIGRAHV